MKLPLIVKIALIIVLFLCSPSWPQENIIDIAFVLNASLSLENSEFQDQITTISDAVMIIPGIVGNNDVPQIRVYVFADSAILSIQPTQLRNQKDVDSLSMDIMGLSRTNLFLFPIVTNTTQGLSQAVEDLSISNFRTVILFVTNFLGNTGQEEQTIPLTIESANSIGIELHVKAISDSTVFDFFQQQPIENVSFAKDFKEDFRQILEDDLHDIITSVEFPPETSIPKDFELEQNFPNPFNPTTTIQYGLPKASEVKLIIYNILGQRVRTLVDKRQEAGFQSIEWNSKNEFGLPVAAGVYIYRIEADNFVQAKKLLLLK